MRLRTAVVECEYTCPECRFNLSDVNIKDQFVSGLYNETLQTDILAKNNQLVTLTSIIDHAKAYETAMRHQSELHDSAEVRAARMSDYKRKQSNGRFRKQSNKQQSCSGCGSNSHGIQGTPERANNCPAWGKTCNKCNILNHFASVCRQTTPTNHIDMEAASSTTISNANGRVA